MERKGIFSNTSLDITKDKKDHMFKSEKIGVYAWTYLEFYRNTIH